MEEVICLTKDLIGFRSTHDNREEINRCADFIETYLKKHHIACRRLSHENIPSILVAPQRGTVPVMFMTHIDVVEGPTELYKPYEKNGNLYGRGSLDDKYAVALSLVLLKENFKKIQKAGGSLDNLPFGILITGDEEVGGAHGAGKALAQVKTNFCVAIDGGRVDKIIVKEKGILHLKLISRGKSVHSARPWLGVNAIDNLIADYQVIKTNFEQSAPEQWLRTLNFSLMRAGKTINQVPDYAEAVFDVRYTENDDIEALVANIKNNIQGRIIVEKNEPLFMSGNSPYLDLLLSIAGGTSAGFEHGSSDARYLSQFGIKGIVWGADGEMSHHSTEEHVNIASIHRLYELLDRFTQRFSEISLEKVSTLT